MNLILYNILNYLQNKDLLSFNIILNNYRYFEYDSNIIFYELKETLKYILKNRYNLKKRFNRFIEYQNLKKNFKNTIFDEDFIYEFPIYNYHGNFLGGTDFINYIYPEDIYFPIMIGIDSWKRPFIIIKYKFLGGNITQFEVNHEFEINKEYILVIYQRMFGIKNWWCQLNCEKDNGPLLIGKECNLDDLDMVMILENIKLLLKGENPYYAQFQSNLDVDVNFEQINCKLAY